MTRIQNALRSYISIKIGFGQREIVADLERLGFEAPTRKDLTAIGGFEHPITGVWSLAPERRSCDIQTYMVRGEALERLSHKFNTLGAAAWEKRRNNMLLRYIREDMRAC